MSKRLETRDVRDGYACNCIQYDLTVSEAYELFDEWFNEVRADAWDEGLEAAQRAESLRTYTPDNPYREES